jgi:hypothetical protein
MEVGESPMKRFKSSIQKADDEMIHHEGLNDAGRFEDPIVEEEEMISTPIKSKEPEKSKNNSNRKYAKKTVSPMVFKLPTEVALNSPSKPTIPPTKREIPNSAEKKKSMSRELKEIEQQTKDFVMGNLSQENSPSPSGKHNTMRKTTTGGSLVKMDLSPNPKKRGRPRKESDSPTSVYVEEDEDSSTKAQDLLLELESGLITIWHQRKSWMSQTEQAKSISDFSEVLLEFVDNLNFIFVSGFNQKKMKEKIGKILNFEGYWKILLEIKSNIEGKNFDEAFDHQRWVEKLNNKGDKKKGK